MKFRDWHGKEYELPKDKTASWRPSANAIIQKDGKVLLVRVKQHDLWELPGGGVELNEPIAEALKREVYEETGYNIVVKGYCPVHMEDNFFYAPDIDEFFHALPMAFFAELENDKQELAHINFDKEIHEIKWFKLSEIPKNVHKRTLDVLKIISEV